MANKDPAAVIAKLEHAPYAARFKEVFGQNVFAARAKAFTQPMYAIEHFELADPSFHPDPSKFDYCIDAKSQLTAHGVKRQKAVRQSFGSPCA